MSVSVKQLCDNACAALITCGSASMPTCSNDCQTNGTATYFNCLRAANNDCNAVTVCIFTAACGGFGPSGTATCKATASCEGNCNVSNPTAACGCGCIAAMSPSTAFLLLINNQCANYASCPSCNPATFNGAQCNACSSACVAADQCSQH